ncbi:MAG: outer membrane beta-barrel protein [Thermoproteota archaeon]|jgi:outer membrane beta-barrel protein
MEKIVLLLLLLTFSMTALSSEKSVYDFSWLDKDKQIYVLQNRKFKKSGTLSLSAALGQSATKIYVDSYSFQGRASYFFTEDWGLEAVYIKSTGDYNDLADAVLGAGAVPFGRIINSYVGGVLTWSPMYSKINMFNQIFYYDWTFSAGLVSVDTSDNRVRFATSTDTSLTDETSTGLIFGSSMLFYISKNWGARIDLSIIRYEADFFVADGVSEKYWFRNTDIFAGINYMF